MSEYLMLEGVNGLDNGSLEMILLGWGPENTFPVC